MKRVITILLAVCTIGIASAHVAAQTPPAARQQCDLTSILKEVSDFKSAGDDTKDIAALLKLRSDIDVADVSCNGYSFKGTGQKIIGPLDMQAGEYKFTVTTKGNFISWLKVIDGTCDGGSALAFFYITEDGEASDGSESLLNSGGCRMILDPKEATAPWMLTIEPLQ